MQKLEEYIARMKPLSLGHRTTKQCITSVVIQAAGRERAPKSARPILVPRCALGRVYSGTHWCNLTFLSSLHLLAPPFKLGFLHSNLDFDMKTALQRL